MEIQMADDRQLAVAEPDAAATEAARAQEIRARSALAQAATLADLRMAASEKVDREAREGASSRFGFYLVTGILVAALVVVVMWLATQDSRISASSPSGGSVPVQTGQAQQTPSVAPPPTATTPVPQGPAGPQGAAGPSAPAAPATPSGQPPGGQ